MKTLASFLDLFILQSHTIKYISIPFSSIQFIQQNNSQTPPPNHFLNHHNSIFNLFSQQYHFNPQYHSGSCISHFYFGSESQFSSHRPSQVSNLQHSATVKKKMTQTQTKETSPNWTKDEDESLHKA